MKKSFVLIGLILSIGSCCYAAPHSGFHQNDPNKMMPVKPVRTIHSRMNYSHPSFSRPRIIRINYSSGYPVYIRSDYVYHNNCGRCPKNYYRYGSGAYVNFGFPITF